MKRLFVTGTDTEVGKTFIARKILRQFAAEQQRVVGFKPIASGCDFIDGDWRNPDALTLQANSSVQLDYSLVNPFCFREAIAPHIAANNQGVAMDSQALGNAYRRLLALSPACIVTEGAGGWRVPLGNGQFMSDFVKQQQMSVVLVIGLRLGCLNHARLTAEAIVQDGLPLAGWVVNQIDPQMPSQAENLLALQEQIMHDFDSRYLGFQGQETATAVNAAEPMATTADLSSLLTA